MSLNFDWNQFELAKPENQDTQISQKSIQMIPNQKESSKTFDWNQFQEAYEPEKEKNFIQEIPRHTARTLSRAAETIGGIPGDIGSLIQSGVLTGLEKLTGHQLSKEGYEELKKYREPTSSELKQFSEETTSGFTKAQTEKEKTSDEIAETVTSLIGPMKFRKALGVGLGAVAAKEGLKIFGIGEKGQEAGKLGTMFLLTAMNPGGALKYSKEQFQKADLLAKGASINSKKMFDNLNNLKTDLLKGVSTAEKNTVLKPIEELLEKSKSGKIPVQELTAAKRDINKLMGEPETLKGAKKLLKVVGKEVDKAIKPYELANPSFEKAYRPANEIFGAVMQGNKAQNTIKKALGAKSILGAVAGEIALGHPEYIIPTFGAAAGALGTAKGVDFFIRLAKSPELQKFYTKAMVAAAAEDIGALRFYSNKIDEHFNK